MTKNLDPDLRQIQKDETVELAAIKANLELGKYKAEQTCFWICIMIFAIIILSVIGSCAMDASRNDKLREQGIEVPSWEEEHLGA